MLGKYSNYLGFGSHIKNERIAFGYVSDDDYMLDGKCFQLYQTYRGFRDTAYEEFRVRRCESKES